VPRKFDMADYYYHSRDIASRYDISLNQAGCHICQYPNESLCNKCQWVEKCRGIYDWEKNIEGNVYGK
jgi:hypothetical protein